MADLALTVRWGNADQARASLTQRVAPLCRAIWEAGGVAEIEVRTAEDRLRDRQRNYLNGVVFRTIARQARGLDGQTFPMEIWKEYFRERYLGSKTVTWVNPITGELSQREERRSTEDLGVKGYSEYIDRVSAFAATELKVTFVDFQTWERVQVDPDTGEIIGGIAA